MFSHYELSNDDFEVAFREGTFPPECFGHEAHLRLAWIHIGQYGITQALENICTQLRSFTKRVGAEDKYNHTLTIAAARTVFHFMQKSRSNNFHDFMQEYPRLRTHFRELIFAHYSTDIFTNERAKREWMEPELLPYN